MADYYFKKRIYLVRHGESEGNIGNLHGHPDHALTPKGHSQAEFIAARCAKLPVEALISSTFLRAQETASYIGKVLGKEAELSDLFVEVQAPSNLRNKPRDDAETTEAETILRANFGVEGFRYEDADNFEDIKTRAGRALELLSARPEENILVVTHGYFMRLLIAYALFGAELTPREAQRFVRTFHMENTGLTVLGYDASQDLTPWWLWVWNDHAHLG